MAAAGMGIAVGVAVETGVQGGVMPPEADTGADPNAVSEYFERTGGEQTPQDGFESVFRAETAITSIDLRLDVGEKIVRSGESESVVLDGERSTHVYGDLSCMRGKRTTRVAGNYDRHTGRTEMIVLSGGQVSEEVRGNVDIRASFEYETIMGGSYLSTNVGPFMRLLAVSDLLAWGGWVDADMSRVEVAKFCMKCYFAYAHRTLSREVLSYHYLDDFMVRTETFGTLQDNTTLYVDAGEPGSGVTSEM